MVGPFMQGAVLLGIIYWYSKGMLNLINEYYRAEFNKHIQKDQPNKTNTAEDEIEALLRADEEIEDRESLLRGDHLDGGFCPTNHEPDTCINKMNINRFLELMLSICFDNNRPGMVSISIGNHYEGCQKGILVGGNNDINT